MTRLLVGLALATVVVAAGTVVEAGFSRPVAQGDDDRPVTMNGCVVKRVAPQDPITFQDDKGFKYRITGRNVGRYQGQRVELLGTSPVPRRFTVRGGLFPSPNVAGRAGDLDPAREAIARQPGGPESGTGNADRLPEFRVTRIRVVEGACE